MERLLRWVGPILLLAGIALLAAAVASGAARLYLVVVVPVLTGGSPLLYGGTALVFVGILLFPFLFADRGPGEAPGPARSAPPPPPGSTSTSYGGVVLIGPVPIVLGRNWGLPRRVYLLLVLFGTALLVLWLVLALLFELRG